MTIWQSSIGKKLITGVTGLGLVTFVIIHMLGNWALFWSPETYNQYGHFIEQLGPLVWLLELTLLGFVGLHVVFGVRLYFANRKARPVGYTQYVSAGSPSYQSLSSRSMIFTGLGLGCFLVWHLLTFKFGVRYMVAGSEVRDLARLVVEKFQQPLYTFSYTAVMGILALHLRHGIWSALQSLGALNQGWRTVAYGLSLLLAIGIAVSFLILPLAIYGGMLG